MLCLYKLWWDLIQLRDIQSIGLLPTTTRATSCNCKAIIYTNTFFVYDPVSVVFYLLGYDFFAEFCRPINDILSKQKVKTEMHICCLVSSKVIHTIKRIVTFSFPWFRSTTCDKDNKSFRHRNKTNVRVRYRICGW